MDLHLDQRQRVGVHELEAGLLVRSLDLVGAISATNIGNAA
jgi:hypothetical protein